MMGRTKKGRKLWSERRIGVPGFFVRLTELEPGGILYVVRMVEGRQKARSLGHRDKKQAKTEALELSLELSKGAPLPASKRATATGPAPGEVLTLGGLVDLYEVHGLQRGSEKYRVHQVAKLRRLLAFLGEDRAAVSLCDSDLQAFTAHRKANGSRQGTIAADLVALKIALNFAVNRHKRADGSRLLEANPLQGVRIDRERAPMTPIAKADRYAALKAVADQLPAAFELALDLAWATGHRIGAILGLRWRDVALEASPECPHGAIRWYADEEADNKKVDHVVPMNALARAALERARPDIINPDAWVFPAEKDPSRPTRYDVARNWMRQAEKLAGLPELKGGKWHPFRRGWATALKHHPLKDLAEAGGWRNPQMPLRYIHTDAETVLAVVNG